MPTPSGLPTKEDFQNATLDVEHLGRVVNSKDAQGNPITTSTNRTGGVNKTLDALEAEYTEAIRNAGGQPLGDGTWQAGQTFTAYNQFMVYNGIAYKPLTTTTLPYGPTGATPDLAFVGPFSDVTDADITAAQGELIGGVVFPSSGDLAVGMTVPIGTTHLRVGGAIYAMSPIATGSVTVIGADSATIGGVSVDLTPAMDLYAKRIEAPYVIAVQKSLIQEAVDKAAASTKPYPQINSATNSGSVVIDLGGGAVVIDRPIELPAGAGGYTFANGLIAPNVSNFPVGESLIEYVGVGDHPLIGYFNLQMECSRIANAMYVNRYIENWAQGLRIHGQKDWGIRIGSDLGFEFNTGPGCTIAEYYNNEAGYLSPTSVGLLIDVGGAADNKFNALVVKYCKRQFDIGSQANKFNGCHFYGTGVDQYNSNGRSVIRGNAKRNQFNGTYLDTCGLEIQNPSQMQFLGGRLAAASSVDASSYVHLNAITANHNMDAFIFRDNIFSIIGDYQARAFTWQGTVGRVRDTDVSNNSVDLQGGVGENPSIKMHSTKAYKRIFVAGQNSVTAQFNDVLLWDTSIQRLIDSEVELSNIQPHNTQFSGRNVTVTLPAGQFANITLRTSVDASSRFSEIADQYPL